MPSVKTKRLIEPWEWMDFDDVMAMDVAEAAVARGVTAEMIDDMEVKIMMAGRIISSPLFTIRNLFFTASKTREIVKIDPFIGQLILDVCLESQRRRHVAQRVIEIKPRQVGWTAWNMARAMWYAMQPNNTVMVFVQDEEVVKKFMERFGNMYNNLGWATPMRRIDNQKQLVLENPNPKLREVMPGLGSGVSVAVPSGKRGKTPNVAILSEFAFYEDMGVDTDEFLDGIMSGMSAGEESCVVIDTTPNGFDDSYKPMVDEACKNNPNWVASWERKGAPTRDEISRGAFGAPENPEDGWVPAFMPWHWHEEYTTKDQSPLGQRPKLSKDQRAHLLDTLGKLPEYGGDEEIELMERYGATIYNLAWRRWKIRNDIQGYDERFKLITFRQEYATNYRDCFVDFGSTAFDPLGMDVLRRGIRSTPYRGMLERADNASTIGWKIRTDWISDWEDMRFWGHPEQGEKYVIGVDLGWSFEDRTADETVAQVIRRRDRKQMAIYTSRAQMHVVRQRLHDLYKYYNGAFVAIETKGPGKNLVRELYDMGVTNQYHWKRLDKEFVTDTDFLGWETSPHTRPMMEGILCEEIAMRDRQGKPEPGIILRDEQTLNQMLSCKRDGDGKIKARGSNHDDCVDALMIALAANRDPTNPYTPPRSQQVKEVAQAIKWFESVSRGVFSHKTKNMPDLRDL